MLSNWHEAKIQSLLEENKQLRAHLEQTRRQCASLISTNAHLELRLKSTSSDDDSPSSSSGHGKSVSRVPSEYSIHSNASDPTPGTGALKRTRPHDQSCPPVYVSRAPSSGMQPTPYTSQPLRIKSSSVPRSLASLPNQDCFRAVNTQNENLADYSYVPTEGQLIHIFSDQRQCNEALRHGVDHAASFASAASSNRHTPNFHPESMPTMTQLDWTSDRDRSQAKRGLR